MNPPYSQIMIMFTENLLNQWNSSCEGTIFEYNITAKLIAEDFMEPTLDKFSEETELYLISERIPSTQNWKYSSSLMMFEDYSEQFSDAIPDLENQ